MKNFKRFASVVIVIMMMLSMMIPAMAASITVTGAKNGETYTAYKIFDVTINEDESAYSYTIASNSEWKTVIENYKVNDEKVFTLTPSASEPTVLVVTYEEGIDGAALAAYLDANKTGKSATKEVTAADEKAELKDLDEGYYFVDTTLGSLCALFTTDTNAELKEKNTIPTITKTQSDTDLQIGETVTYTITVTDSKGTDAAITVHDVMESGLTLKEDSFVISVDNTVVAKSNYEIKSECDDGCTFEITFTAEYVESLEENKVITITYDARLNKGAEISTETNDNKTWLTYSQQTTEEVVVTLETYKFDVQKVDNKGNNLDGAKFKLYDAVTEGNVIKVVGSNGVYRVADTDETGVEEMETDANGKLVVTGLDKKAYYLEETVAPAGYNKLTSREVVDLSKGNNTNNIKIVNQSGTELPSTGGIGTTIFYCVGAVLAVGAFVLLITKKRMSREM